jgi:hypothetical protein
MKKSTANLEKISLNLFRGDFRRLRQLHGDLGGGAVVRTLVRTYIQKKEAELAAEVRKLTPILEESS